MTNTTLSPAYRGPARITLATALGALFLAGPMAAMAHAVATVPPLATASAFSVLAGSTVTNTGPTTVDRSVGVHPGTAVTGRNTMTVGGTVHQATPVALQAKEDLTNAYDDAAGQTDGVTVVDDELGGETLPGGIYRHNSGMGLTGALTLDGENNPNSVWVFQASSTLTTASNASVVLINQANPCNVFWQVGSSATLGTSTAFVGTIMALTSITMNSGATIRGRTLARNGQVSLNNNVFTSPDCAYDEEVEDAPEDDTLGPQTPGGDTTPGGGDSTPGGDNNPRGGSNPAGNNPAGSDNPLAANQVADVPEGSVDTGFAGNENGSTSDLAPVGWALAAGFGGLALLALRRRRVM